MAAVLTPHQIHSTESRPTPGTSPTRVRPALIVIDGGRSAEGIRSRRMYRRRRVVALLTIVIVGWMIFSVAMSIATAMISPTAQVTPSAQVTTSPVPSSDIAGGGAAASRHVVRPGETLWSIATSLHVDGDIRDTMAQLAETNGDGLLRSGQVLVIPEELWP
jgi:LysM repeat protein